MSYGKKIENDEDQYMALTQKTFDESLYDAPKPTGQQQQLQDTYDSPKKLIQSQPYFEYNDVLPTEQYQGKQEQLDAYDSPRQLLQQQQDVYDSPKQLIQQQHNGYDDVLVSSSQRDLYEPMQAGTSPPQPFNINNNKPQLLQYNDNIYGNVNSGEALYGNIQSTFN